MSAQRGFTLIELVVVVAIMGVVGAFTLANFRSFGDDQKLKNGLLDIQSMLRTAQTNTTTNVKCDTKYGARWSVAFVNSGTLELGCMEPSGLIQNPWNQATLKKTLTLDSSITIKNASLSPSAQCPGSQPFSVVFSPIDGTIFFYKSPSEYLNCTTATITLQNTKSQTKTFVIEKGGRIYEQ